MAGHLASRDSRHAVSEMTTGRKDRGNQFEGVGDERDVVRALYTHRVLRLSRSENTPTGKLARSFLAMSLDEWDTACNTREAPQEESYQTSIITLWLCTMGQCTYYGKVFCTYATGCDSGKECHQPPIPSKHWPGSMIRWSFVFVQTLSQTVHTKGGAKNRICFAETHNNSSFVRPSKKPSGTLTNLFD